jgi:hypothetical protein
MRLMIEETENLTDVQQRVFDIMQKFGFSDFYADYSQFSRLLFEEPYIEWYTAKCFAEETANKDNFFMNSICFWKDSNYRPKREPDHVSRNRDFEVSSKYWYTPKGVYRQSDHWGEGVASCDWYWKSSKSYKKYDGKVNEILTYNRTYIGFAEWSDFAPKGYIVTPQGNLDTMRLMGFKFKK